MNNAFVLSPDWRVAVDLLDLHNDARPTGDLRGYDHVMLFFLLQESVVGKAILPVIDGVIVPEALSTAVNRIWEDVKDRPPALRYRATLPFPFSPTFSVVVCTRDRVQCLRECLDSLLAIDWPNPEIVVVDNSSRTEETQKLLREFPPIRYVRCAQPGLNRARNAGIRSTSGEIVAFTDDDARVLPTWLRGFAANFRDPMVAVTAGITLPALLDSRPAIEFEMTSPFTKGFSRREFTVSNTNMTTIAHIGAGVNMAIRRSFLNEIGLFDERLDGGTPTLSGGDHEFFFRVITRGYRIAYDPAAAVWHQHRISRTAAIHTVFGYGVGVTGWWTRTLLCEREFSALLRIPICLVRYYLQRAVTSLLRRRGSPPLGYAVAELRGALYGPFAYLKSLMAETE